MNRSINTEERGGRRSRAPKLQKASFLGLQSSRNPAEQPGIELRRPGFPTFRGLEAK